ncbi:MAG: hypothetical protein HZA50_02195 [Planctomycetes bacterium]|nr:hypothetical protein [Planctomycetota bacterium]
MKSRLIPAFFVAGVMLAVCAWADDPSSKPASPLGRVLSELRKIQPPMYDPGKIEEGLAAMGKDSLPALREARAMGVKLVGDDELATDRYSTPDGGTIVDGSPREDRVKRLAEIRIGVLDRAIIRLDWGFNPPDVLARWAAKREAKEKDAHQLPGQLQHVADPLVARAFPDLLWFWVAKPQMPVMRADEDPSAWPVRSLFAIDRKAGVAHFTDAKALEKFFRANLPPVKAEPDAKAAVEVWLILSQTLQDHAAFPVERDSLKITKPDGGGWLAGGRASQGMGQAGQIKAVNDAGFVEVKMAFDAEGKLKEAGENIKVRPGLRPICQSTKLLDPDPIVRTMAERELRLMGRSAEAYLKARRAKASPQLQAAIDRIWRQILDDEHDFGW